jgi:hypothetical protein
MFVSIKDAQVARGQGEGLPLVCIKKKPSRQPVYSLFQWNVNRLYPEKKVGSDIVRANSLYSEYFPRELGDWSHVECSDKQDIAKCNLQFVTSYSVFVLMYFICCDLKLLGGYLQSLLVLSIWSGAISQTKVSRCVCARARVCVCGGGGATVVVISLTAAYKPSSTWIIHG